jgi:hypothetical protein
MFDYFLFLAMAMRSPKLSQENEFFYFSGFFLIQISDFIQMSVFEGALQINLPGKFINSLKKCTGLPTSYLSTKSIG